jgi:hypothetical protein
MPTEDAIKLELEKLRLDMPGPFELSAQLDEFFANNPVARRLVAGGKKSVRALLAVIRESRDPSIIRVAALVLSRFEPEEVYQVMLSVIERADQAVVQALEPGLWRLRLPEERIAKDLTRIARTAAKPDVLLLLQRPAARHVRPDLWAFVEEDRLSISLNALFCLGYALESTDIPALRSVMEKSAWPEIRALAGAYLLRLGCKEGTKGIQDGLTAASPALRETTYREISTFLPRETFDEANYDPAKPGELQARAVGILLDHLRR